MAKKKQKTRKRQIGKTEVKKKPIIDPKHKNTFWTIVVVIILLIFFIVNNTGKEPEEGPYPPGYQPQKIETNKIN